MIQRPYTAFWGEMSAFEHFVQIYEKEELYLDTLADYAGHGIESGDAVVLILTPTHREAIELRLRRQGFGVSALQDDDQLILLDAAGTLTKFMVNDWPDDKLFEGVVTSILRRAAGKNQRKVRAFGEMVALMWAQGQCGATIRLEHLWHALCKKESLPLFCAYPKSGHTEHPHDSISQLCAIHSKVLIE